MGGLASAPGIRSIGDIINLSTPGGILFVDAAGAFQEDTAHLFWDRTLGNITFSATTQPNLITLGIGYLGVDASNTVLGNNACGKGGAVLAYAGRRLTAVGAGALQALTNATGTVAIGTLALNKTDNTTANTAVGSEALALLGATGIESDNTAIGFQAMAAYIGGAGSSKCTAVGSGALKGTANAVGANNTAVGYHAMFNNFNSQACVCIGLQAGDQLNTAANNTLIGALAGHNVVNKTNNTMVGYGATSTVDVASCIVIGANATVTGDNAIAIGTTTNVAVNNIEIGNAAHTDTTLHGTVHMSGGITTGNAAALVTTSVAMNNGAAAAVGTLNNGPVAGNPTKWVPFNDNGTVRYIPTW